MGRKQRGIEPMGQKQGSNGTTFALTDAERASRQHAVDNAIASQRLEGLEVDAEVIKQLHDYAEGRREIGDIVEAFKRRIVGGTLRPGGKP